MKRYLKNILYAGLIILYAGLVPAPSESVDAVAFGQPPEETSIVFHGWGKIRLENVTASADRVADVFGNETEETTTVDHRFFLEGTTRIGEHVQAGVMFRFSSEPDDVLLDGPVLLENERGSVFAGFSNHWLDARLGYYDIAFTPLTLMRYDPLDIPDGAVGTGGGVGCGCVAPGVAATTSLLEDIREELTFEGGRLNMLYGDHLEATALYARSRAPLDGRSFRRHTLGARALFRYYLPHAADDLELSLQFVYHDDEEGSIASPPVDQPLDNRVAGVYLKAPVVRNARVFIEAARSRLEREPFPGRFSAVEPVKGNAVTAGLAADLPGNIGLEGAYLYRARHFESLYGALTYMGNRQGARINLSWTSPTDVVAMDVFGRYLEEVKAETPGGAQSFLTCGAGVTVLPLPDVSIRLSGVMEEQKKDAAHAINDIDARIAYGILRAVYRVFRDNDMELKYQYANYRDRGDGFDHYETHTITSEIRIRF